VLAVHHITPINLPLLASGRLLIAVDTYH